MARLYHSFIWAESDHVSFFEAETLMPAENLSAADEILVEKEALHSKAENSMPQNLPLTLPEKPFIQSAGGFTEIPHLKAESSEGKKTSGISAFHCKEPPS